MTPSGIASLASIVRAVRAGVDPEGFFSRRADTRGPVRLLFPGMGEVVFFGSRSGARAVLIAPSSACRAPTPNPVEPIVGSASLILISGAEHRRQRGLLMPAFHSERVDGYTDLIASATRDEIRLLRPGQPVGLHALAVAITLRVAIRVVFGVCDTDRHAEYTTAITALMRANTAPLMLVPALRRELAGRGPWARLIELRDRLDRMLRDDMASRDGVGDRPIDMLSVLMSATDDAGVPRTAGELCDQLRTLLAAGHDTTASALAWAMYHIHRENGVRERILSELSATGSVPAMPSLPYLSAVVKETLRLHPPVPIVLRRLTEPMVIDNETYPVGQIIGIALYSLHRNPELWPNPERFDPERFLRQRVSPFDYAPFGGGHRRCIGAGFAATELAVAIGTILTTWEFHMPPSERDRGAPRSVPRGIAVTPARDMVVDLVGAVAPT